MPDLAHVSLACQADDCLDSTDVDVDETQLGSTIESLAEAEGWGWHYDSRMNGTFCCSECLDRLQNEEQEAEEERAERRAEA